MLALGTLLFSIKGILIKLAYAWGVSPTVIMTIRMLIALPFYLWVLMQQTRKGHLQKLSLPTLLACLVLGLFGFYIASWLDLSGLLYLPASIERLILYTYPTIVLLLSFLFLGQRLSKTLLLSLVIIYAGLMTVFIPDMLAVSQGNIDRLFWLGAAMVFGSAIAFAIYLTGSEVMMRRLPSKLFTALAMISASLAIVIHYSLTHPWSELLQQAPPVYAYAVAIAIFCTVIPSFLVSSGIQRVGAATGSMVGGISPIFTLVLAAIFLGEGISGLQGLGFILVIGGVINLSRSKRTD